MKVKKLHAPGVRPGSPQHIEKINNMRAIVHLDNSSSFLKRNVSFYIAQKHRKIMTDDAPDLAQCEHSTLMSRYNLGKRQIVDLDSIRCDKPVHVKVPQKNARVPGRNGDRIIKMGDIPFTGIGGFS
jgi:hypothetical protein